MLVAAVMYSARKLPQGRLDLTSVPPPEALDPSSEPAHDSLRVLNTVLSSAGEADEFARLSGFAAARTSTQRMPSRQVRFEFFCRALAGEFASP